MLLEDAIMTNRSMKTGFNFLSSKQKYTQTKMCIICNSLHNFRHIHLYFSGKECEHRIKGT